MVGAHTCSPEQPPQECRDLRQRMDHQLRNLFWVCYALDKEISLRTGQPPSINDDHCDLSLPPDYGKHLHVPFRTHYVSGESMIEIPLLGDFRLSKIKARAYTMLYSVGALRKSDAEVLKAIRELDNELETWRLSLPQKCRPTLSFSKGSPITEGDLDMQVVMLRLDYHHCMAIIHQASGRCLAWTNNHNGIMEGVSSSLALSVEACRSSLAYLQTAQHVLPADSFWYVPQLILFILHIGGTNHRSGSFSSIPCLQSSRSSATSSLTPSTVLPPPTWSLSGVSQRSSEPCQSASSP